MIKLNKRAMKIMFSIALCFLFLFLSISSASALSYSLLQTGSMTYTDGSAGLHFDSNGNLYATGNRLDNKPNFLSKYEFGIAYDLSTMANTQNINLTSLFPTPYMNYSVLASTISRNGDNLYLITVNRSTEWNLADIHYLNFAVMHFTMNNYDLSTLNYSDNFNFTQLGITAYAPYFSGIDISDDGKTLTMSGKNKDSPRQPLISLTESAISKIYNLTNAFYLNSSTQINSYYSDNLGSYSSASRDNIGYIAPDRSFAVVNRFNPVGTGVIYVSYNNTSLDILDNDESIESLTVAQTFTNIYLFTQINGVIKKYQLEGITTFESETVNQTQGQEILTDQVINPIINLFPEHTTLTFKEKMGYVFIVMLLTVLIILFAGYHANDGMHTLLIYIIAVILVVEILFFIAIRYIPIGFIIIFVLFGVFISFLKLKGNSGGS